MTLGELADEIVDLVTHAELSVMRGDSAGTVMFGAYVRAFRRFKAIVTLAHDGAGDEVFVLTRSLLSLLARAAYVDAPTDSAQRRERWERLVKADLADKVATLAGMQTVGIEIDQAELSERRSQLAGFETTKNLPSDRQLLEVLDLSTFYHRVYRSGSDFAHFTFGVAVAEIEDVESVALHAVNEQLVKEGLALAILTYGQFLEKSQRAVGHGLTPKVLALVAACSDFP